MDQIRVLIADDHALLRAGLRSLCDQLEGVEVVGDAADGRQALEMVATLSPEILMTDISMPELNGLELTTRVAREFPRTKSIILSMHTEPEYAAEALGAGAVGYLIKDSGTSEIELAIRAVARGESYLSPAISKHFAPGSLKSAEPPRPANPLTPRQLEVLKLIAEGNTTKAIAHRLDISVKTADSHRVQLMERLGIHEIAGLVRYAIRTGLVEADV
jgi:DNA-binding NarL/FixJ family response regulator